MLNIHRNKGLQPLVIRSSLFYSLSSSFMSRLHLTQLVLGSFLCGVWIASFNVNLGIVLFGSICALSLCLIFFGSAAYSLRLTTYGSLLIGLCLVAGFLRYQSFVPVPNETDLAFYNDQGKFKIVGELCEEIDRRPDKQNLTICAESLNNKQVQGKVLSSVALYPAFHYGAQVELYGKLLTPAEFEDFSYKDYLAVSGIHSVIYNPQIKVLRPASTWSPFGWIFAFKELCEKQIAALWPEPQSSFMAGLLLGSRKGLDAELSENFKITGLSHIIAISGYNITLIIVVLASCLSFLPRRWQMLVTLGVIVLFTILVGASAAVVRASLMGILSLLVLNAERPSNVLSLLLLSAALMVAHNPLLLRYDIGFQLSFLATAGLVYFSKSFEKLLGFVPSTFNLKESLSLTLSAQLTTLPIMAGNFGRVSMIAPLANLLVAPAIPFSMLTGFLSLPLSLVSESLANLCGYPAWLTLTYIIKVSTLCAQIPYAAVDFQLSSFWLSFVYYFGLLLFLFWPELKKLLGCFSAPARLK